MTSPYDAVSTSFSAVLSASSGTISIGNVVLPDSTSGLYVKATTANRGTRRATGISLMAANAGEAIQVLQFGQVSTTISGLGSGLASWVRTSSTGTLERVASPSASDDLVGYCETDGTLHACFGVLSATNVSAAGSDTQVIFNDGGSYAGNAGLVFKKTLGTFIAGSSAAASPSTVGAIALGNAATANGDGAVAIGSTATASQTYCVAIGKTCTASIAGAVAIGENSTASGTNGQALGYTCTASGTYSSVIGHFCTASETGSIACGYQASSNRPGMFAHSSGISNLQGGNAIDLGVALNGTSGNLKDVAGNEFAFSTNTTGVGILRLVAATVSGSAKRCTEVYTIQFKAQPGPSLTLDSVYLISDATVRASTVAAGGGGFWSTTISAPSGFTFRIAFNPGTDNVRVLARFEWSEIGNL